MHKIWFTDFWQADEDVVQKFKYFDKSFLKAFNFKLDRNNPDLLIYSWRGENHKNYSCKKMFFMPENARKTYLMNDRFRQDFHNKLLAKNYDYLAINNSIEEDFFDKSKVLQFQSYFCRWGFEAAIDKILNRKLNPSPKKDICMVYSSGLPERYLFAKMIHDRFSNTGLYGPFVDNPIEKIIKPKHENNFAGWHCFEARIQIASQYKFEVAIENSRAPGHTTEKLHEAYASGCIPIYCGARNLKDIGINSNAVVSCDDLSVAGITKVLDQVSEILNDENRFFEKRNQPLYLPGWNPKENWDNFFQMVSQDIAGGSNEKI